MNGIPIEKLAEVPAVVQLLGTAMPIGRTARPEEIAEATLFLASPRASYVTGTILAAGGGGSIH